MIPAHLAWYDWYPGHLAWIASQGHTTAHVPPEGTAPKRAELSDADFRGAYLRGADLRDADLLDACLTGANLTGACLHGADLEGADLRGADLTGADLRDADLKGADLRGAVLRNAYLAGASLHWANLSRVRGIIAFGPVGEHGRIIYGVAHPAATMVRAGCWWGTLDDTRAAVAEHYADGTGREHHRATYLAALDVISAALGGSS